MPSTRPSTTSRIDTLMEAASRALVQRRYFECERFCMEALERAFVGADYERMSRILLPLEESRRQKRDLAFDAHAVFLVIDALPVGKALVPGCYLLAPPRVGVDGRLLREATNKKKVPAIIVVREPTSRDGLWPVVSIGPVTIRTKVAPPAAAASASNGRGAAASAPAITPGRRPGKTTLALADAPAPVIPLPPPERFIVANEAIGDKALAGIEPTMNPVSRIEALLKCLQAHPDHEKLHQVLGEACREAAKMPVKTVRPRVVKAAPDEDSDEDHHI